MNPRAWHRRHSLFVLLFAFMVGCGGTLGPRTSQPLNWMAWTQNGAMADASRAHPVAFWSEPNANAAEVKVGSQMFAARQWMMHLALRLNSAVNKKTLYDARMSTAGPTLFKWQLRNGHFHYTHVGTRDENQALIHTSGARAVEVRFLDLRRSIGSGKETMTLRVQFVVGARKLVVVGTSVDPVRWDADCVDAVGRSVLADGRFWRAAEVM